MKEKLEIKLKHWLMALGIMMSITLGLFAIFFIAKFVLFDVLLEHYFTGKELLELKVCISLLAFLALILTIGIQGIAKNLAEKEIKREKLQSRLPLWKNQKNEKDFKKLNKKILKAAFCICLVLTMFFGLAYIGNILDEAVKADESIAVSVMGLYMVVPALCAYIAIQIFDKLRIYEDFFEK